MRRAAPALLAVTLAACVTSDDPADGGFANAIGGVAGGGYDARIETREAEVAASQLRGEELTAELARLRGEHEGLKDRIIQQRAALSGQGVRLSAETEARVQQAILSDPSEADPSARAASLQRAIADARQLSEQLAALSS